MSGIKAYVKSSPSKFFRHGSIESLSDDIGRTFVKASRVGVKDLRRQEGYKNKHISLFYINLSLLPAHARAMCACVYASACRGTVNDFRERFAEAFPAAANRVRSLLLEPHMSHQSCLTCCFYDSPATGAGQGECHRHPPVVPLAYQGRHDDLRLGLWPRVEAVSWCGQYQPRTDATSRDETNKVEPNTH